MASAEWATQAAAETAAHSHRKCAFQAATRDSKCGEALIPDCLVKRSRIVPARLDRPRSRGHQTDLLQGAVLVKKDPQPKSPLSQPVDTPPNRSDSIIRVLLVDDHEPFRQFVRATLNARPGTEVVSEASDGLDAVQKAQELKPDLIVLDIGLPGLNGLEAARRIRKLSPGSIILFLSQESSADVIREALSIGALGFVIKVCAARDLMVAVESVLRIQQFVSGAF
jgi:CheY-like chemotaxis protein